MRARARRTWALPGHRERMSAGSRWCRVHGVPFDDVGDVVGAVLVVKVESPAHDAFLSLVLHVGSVDSESQILHRVGGEWCRGEVREYLPHRARLRCGSRAGADR